MATGITISILQQYFSRLIAKFLNCTSELLIRHDRGGEIVIFRRWQPAEAALDAKRKDWLKLVYSSRSVPAGDSLLAPLAFCGICLLLNVKTWNRSKHEEGGSEFDTCGNIAPLCLFEETFEVSRVNWQESHAVTCSCELARVFRFNSFLMRHCSSTVKDLVTARQVETNFCFFYFLYMSQYEVV